MRRWLKGAEGSDVVWDMDTDGKLFKMPLDSLKKNCLTNRLYLIL